MQYRPTLVMRFSLVPLCLVVASAAAIGAQAGVVPPVDSTVVDYVYDTGLVSREGAASTSSSETTLVAAFLVEMEGVPWMQLRFDEIELAGSLLEGTASVLRMTAALDGAVQELNAAHCRQWRGRSAYFNGDAVYVELIASPGTGPNRLRLGSLRVGTDPSDYPAICEYPDSRKRSFHSAVGRGMPATCTVWIADDCHRCLISAGHCVQFPLSIVVVEFNVPSSYPGGTLRHSRPRD